MRTTLFLPVSLLLAAGALRTLAQTTEAGLVEKYKPYNAPRPTGLVLQKGDRLAICGDSITEQKMYSRLIEDYLTMCAPELEVSVRQYGWGGEKASGFLARMTNDCLRFKPTIATTCYGMNDHEYRPYEERIGQAYRENSAAIIHAFKASGARVILGSPGCVTKIPTWTKYTNGPLDALNLSLCQLRNIGIGLAQTEKVGFADVFWPMLTAGVTAQSRYGPSYAIAGKDGVHPGWAGHTVMAYAFLRALGLNGDIGGFKIDLQRNLIRATKGHEILSATNGEFQIKSSRYLFCPCIPTAQEPARSSYPVCGEDDPAKDNSLRSAMTLLPFNQELNRLLLVVLNARGTNFQVTWGTESKTYTAAQLARGLYLAEEFPHNPFGAAFAKVDAAIAAKQAFETRQIKEWFHSPEARTNLVEIVARTEKGREPLVAAIRAAFVPVTHTIKIVAK